MKMFKKRLHIKNVGTLKTLFKNFINLKRYKELFNSKIDI